MELDDVSKSIGLNIPQRTSPSKTDFKIHSQNITDWISQLPLVNINQTAKQLYRLLKTTNQLSYSCQKRVQLLEALGEPVEHVTKAMKKNFVGVGLPLPDKNLKTAVITRKLFSVMATGYKIALEDVITSKLSIVTKKNLSMLIHRSITYTGKNLLAAYQAYSPVSNKYWNELHKLYLFAEQQNLINNLVSDNQLHETKTSSIAVEYGRTLLLSLATPSNLRHGEAGKIYTALESWLSKSIIQPLGDDNNTDCFIDNLSGGLAPSTLSTTLTKGINDESQLRVIDTHEISKQLEKELKKHKNIKNSEHKNFDINATDLSYDLLQRLLRTWNIESKRLFPRKEKKEKIKITLGLSATHQFITQKNQLKDTEEYINKYNHRSQFKSGDANQHLLSFDNDVWAQIYPDEPVIQKPKSAQEKIEAAELKLIKDGIVANEFKAEAKHYKTDNWIIVNESCKGLMINNEADLNNKAQVGEVVSIYRPTDDYDKEWSIGIIRWLKFFSDKNLQMGIEIINSSSTAIGIRAAHTTDSPLQRALMLPAVPSLKQPATIITSSVPWKKGNQIDIKIPGMEISVTLTELIQNTGIFSQFNFETAPQNSSKSQNNLKENRSSYDNSWSIV